MLEIHHVTPHISILAKELAEIFYNFLYKNMSSSNFPFIPPDILRYTALAKYKKTGVFILSVNKCLGNPTSSPPFFRSRKKYHDLSAAPLLQIAHSQFGKIPFFPLFRGKCISRTAYYGADIHKTKTRTSALLKGTLA